MSNPGKVDFLLKRKVPMIQEISAHACQEESEERD